MRFSAKRISQTAEDQSYLPFIREDRVWEYFTTDHDYMSYTRHCRLYRWQFIGKEEFEGKNYHRLMQTGQTLWTDHHDNDGTYSDYAEDTTGLYVALMREKSGKVYVRLKDGNNDELQPNFTEERLLYDFGLHPGDTLSFPWYPDGYISRQTFVVDTIDIEYSFEASRILNFVPIEEESAYAPAFVTAIPRVPGSWRYGFHKPLARSCRAIADIQPSTMSTT